MGWNGATEAGGAAVKTRGIAIVLAVLVALIPLAAGDAFGSSPTADRTGAHLRVLETDLELAAAATISYAPSERALIISGSNEDGPVVVTPTGLERTGASVVVPTGAPYAIDGSTGATLSIEGRTLTLDGTPMVELEVQAPITDVAVRGDVAYVLSPGTLSAVNLSSGATTPLALPDRDVANAVAVAVDAIDGAIYLVADGGTRVVKISGDDVEDVQIHPDSIEQIIDIEVAPSADLTDSPEAQSVYLVADAGAGGGATLIEVDLAPQPQALLSVPNDPVSLVRATNTWQWSPPSPDPSGIAYVAASGNLLISDGEVNEIPSLFVGSNLFESSLAGVLLDTAGTLAYSNEPTGAAVAPNGHLFLSDDTGDRGVYEVDPGPDATLYTGDDIVTFISFQAFGSTDPEGVTFDTTRGNVVAVDGLSEEVYTIDPGPNGRFDGVPPSGDDVVTSFDTSALGIRDPEGVEYNPDNDHLYVLSSIDDIVAETTIDGTIVRYLDLNGHGLINPAGIAYAPASSSPTQMNLYVVDRAIDNDNDPNENDGGLFEFSFELNAPPVVFAGDDQTLNDGEVASLSGTVTDDGIPGGPITTQWTAESGPGTVSFGDASALDTTASFSDPGFYTLRLTADDGQATAFDEVGVSVAGSGGEFSFEARVLGGSDDAEERENGSVSTASSDLELVADTGGNQTVGIRFRGVDVPAGATVLSASIQFTVDEATSVATALVIRAEDTDDAATFARSQNDVSGRPQTGAAVNWQPASWPTVGAAGNAQQTPDLATLVQEIVNRTGWNAGNAMAFIITGTGERVAESYDGTPSTAPLLQLTYRTTTPPTVDAGSNATITVGDVASLDGTVTDDGLPNPPGAVTSTWSVVSGPGTVTFADASAVDTTATFSAQGTYVLQLLADDSESQTTDTVTIDVLPQNQAPTADAGPDASVALSDAAVLDGTVTDDGLPNPPGVVTSTWSVVSGPGTVTFADASAVDTTATFSAQGTYVLQLLADDTSLTAADTVTITVTPPVNTGPTVDAGADQSVEFGNAAVLDGTVTDDGLPNPPGAVTSTWSVVSGPGTVTFADASAVDTTATFSAQGTYVLQLLADDSESQTTDTVTIDVLPQNQAPTADAGPDASVALSDAAVLDGTVTDDGLPNPPGVVTSTWSVVSGPGTVTFADASAVDTTATFSAQGTYVLQLLADDTSLTAADTVTITVTPPVNTGPTVDAGADQSVEFGNAAVLDGTVTDDGLPNPPGAVTSTWSVVSGPGTVTFADASAVDTTATFSAQGTYVLQLLADDTSLTAADTVSVGVTAPGSDPVTLVIPVNASSDDAEERANGAIDLVSSDLELVHDRGGEQTVGIRFNNVGIPPGAEITNAYVQFTADEVPIPATTLVVQGEDVDSSATYTGAAFGISTRPRTAAAVDWIPVAWTLIGEAGADQQTPDIAGVVQEIVNRPGWVANNSLSVIITGNGERVAESYDGGTTLAPVLHVTYVPLSQGRPTANAGPDQTVAVTDAAVLDGTVSDDGLPNPPGALTTTWSVVSGPGAVAFADASAVDTTATFSLEGTYVLQLTADDGQLTKSDEVEITVTGVGGEITIDVQVSAGTDDVEEAADGTVSNTSSDLELVDEATNQTVGIRFNAIGVPQGASITAAWIQFTADETDTVATTLNVGAQAVDDAPILQQVLNDITSRILAPTTASWSPPAWNVVGEAAEAQRTSDLSLVVQEIVDRPGWTSGNSMVFVISGSGKRVAESHNGSPAAAPVLHVEFVP